MRSFTLLLILATLAMPVFADKSVRGYTRKNGTAVAPHHRSDSNGTQRDNYSTKGNTNPHTGKAGTKTPKR